MVILYFFTQQIVNSPNFKKEKIFLNTVKFILINYVIIIKIKFFILFYNIRNLRFDFLNDFI